MKLTNGEIAPQPMKLQAELEISFEKRTIQLELIRITLKKRKNSLLETSAEHQALSVDGTKILEKVQSKDRKVDGICSIIVCFMV